MILQDINIVDVFDDDDNDNEEDDEHFIDKNNDHENMMIKMFFIWCLYIKFCFNVVVF